MDYIWKDGRTNMSFVAEEKEKAKKEAKKAELSYKILRSIKKADLFSKATIFQKNKKKFHSLAALGSNNSFLS